MEELKGKKLYHKGITMIALIITVIVLLLLAGIAIANLVGENGTLKKSKKAADDYLYSQAKEEIEIAVNSAIIVSERRKKEITFKQSLQEEFNLEPLYTNNVSNIKEATTEVIGTNREVYRYKINLETGEITDLKIEEQEGKEYKITLSFQTGEIEWNGIRKGVPISIYKYADIDANGKVKICEEFSSLTLLRDVEILDEYFEEGVIDPFELLKIDNIDWRNWKTEIMDRIKADQIHPIEVIQTEVGKKEIAFSSKKLDESLWFVVIGDKEEIFLNSYDENTGEMMYTIDIANDGDLKIAVDPVSSIGITKNRKGLITPDKNQDYNVAESSYHLTWMIRTSINSGNLEITSKINDYKTTQTPSILVYEVKAVLDGNQVFSDIVSAKVEKEQTKIVVENIPRKAQVTVKELYAGTIYSCISSESQSYLQGESNSLTFVHEYNNKTGIEVGSETYEISYDEDEAWNLSILEEKALSRETIPLEIDFSNWTFETGIRNSASSKKAKYVRVKFFASEGDINILDASGKWNSREDGYCYYSEIVGENEVTDRVSIKLENIKEEVNNGEKFHYIIVAETLNAISTGENEYEVPDNVIWP